MSRLFLWNPLDWVRLLWWALVKPDVLWQYKRSPDYEGEEELDKVGNCLSCALAFWPIVLGILWIWPHLTYFQEMEQRLGGQDQAVQLSLQDFLWTVGVVLLAWLLATFLYRFGLTEKAGIWKKVVGWVPMLAVAAVVGIGAFAVLVTAVFAIKIGMGSGAAAALALVIAAFGSFSVAFGIAGKGILMPLSVIFGTAAGMVVGARGIGGMAGDAVDTAGVVIEVLGFIIDLLGGEGQGLVVIVVLAVPMVVGAYVSRYANEGRSSRLAQGVFWSLILSHVTLLWQAAAAWGVLP